MANTPHPMNPKATPSPMSMGDVSVSTTAPPSPAPPPRDVIVGTPTDPRRRVGCRDVTVSVVLSVGGEVRVVPPGGEEGVRGAGGEGEVGRWRGGTVVVGAAGGRVTAGSGRELGVAPSDAEKSQLKRN